MRSPAPYHVADTQIYTFCRPSEIDELSNRVSGSIDEAALWLRANRLQLNHSKTEVLWCTSQRRQHLPALGRLELTLVVNTSFQFRCCQTNAVN